MTFFYELNKRMAELANKQDLHESKVAESEKWIQKAVNPAHKGGLHKALHVAQDKTIPKAKIAKATHSKNPKLRHMAQFAKNVANEEMADEGNAFTGALASTPKGGKFKVGGKEFKDTSSIEEGHCPACDCAPCKCNEGNAFSGAVAKAKADGIQKGETIKVGGKTYPVKEADMVGLGEKKKEPRSKGTAFDKDHMDKLRKEKEAETHSRYDVKDTGYSKRYTRKAADTDVDADDEVKSDAPKKKGRPKGPAKGPERTTKGAWKHKGDRKVKEEETDEGWRGGMLGEPSVVKTGKKDPNAKVEAWNGLMAIVARGEGMEPAALKHLKQIARTLKPEELELDEEKVEAGKREFFDRLAPAAKKAAKVIGAIAKHRTPVEEESTDKEDTKAERAGKKVAKDIEHDEGNKSKGDNKAEKAGKKVTKDIEYDDKKDRKEKKADKEEKVDETADAPKAGKGMQFGKGVYESINREIETLVESMNVSVNMSTDENGEPHKSITVSAEGAEADVLAQLLKAAGIDHQGGSEACSSCGSTPCGCDQQVDENSPDWPTNTETLAADPNLRTYSGGLNGPKSTGQTTVPVVASQLRRQSTMEENVELERSLFKTWKNYKG